MANLLPHEALHNVQRIRRARFMLVGSLVALVCGAVAILALVPTYILASLGDPAKENMLVGDVSLASSADRDDLSRAQVLSKELQPYASSTISMLPIIQEILDLRPKGVTISNINFSRGDLTTIIMSGEAPSRDEINAYRAILLQDPRYASVSVPLGALAGSEDGHFSVTITGMF